MHPKSIFSAARTGSKGLLRSSSWVSTRASSHSTPFRYVLPRLPISSMTFEASRFCSLAGRGMIHGEARLVWSTWNPRSSWALCGALWSYKFTLDLPSFVRSSFGWEGWLLCIEIHAPGTCLPSVLTGLTPSWPLPESIPGRPRFSSCRPLSTDLHERSCDVGRRRREWTNVGPSSGTPLSIEFSGNQTNLSQSVPGEDQGRSLSCQPGPKGKIEDR